MEGSGRAVPDAGRAAGGGDSCALRGVPGVPAFEAPAGRRVKLVTRDQVGSVLISKAEYAGQQLVPPGQAVPGLAFQVAAGSNTLRMVFVFSGSTAGRGELHEDCGGSTQPLRPLAGDEPLQLLRIIGR